MAKESGLVRTDVEMVYVAPSVAAQLSETAFLFEPYARIDP